MRYDLESFDSPDRSVIETGIPTELFHNSNVCAAFPDKAKISNKSMSRDYSSY